MTSKLRHTNIVASYLILKKKDDVLLLKRQHTGYEDGNYGVPSGHVEAGESFTAALIREAREEIGIEIVANDIQNVHIQHRKSDFDNSERVDVYFLVGKWQGEITNCEPQKCSELAWFPADALPQNTIACVQQAILDLLDNRQYREFGW